MVKIKEYYRPASRWASRPRAEESDALGMGVCIVNTKRENQLELFKGLDIAHIWQPAVFFIIV